MDFDYHASSPNRKTVDVSRKLRKEFQWQLSYYFFFVSFFFFTNFLTFTGIWWFWMPTTFISLIIWLRYRHLKNQMTAEYSHSQMHLLIEPDDQELEIANENLELDNSPYPYKFEYRNKQQKF